MSILRHNPWSLFDQMQREINRSAGYPVKAADNGDVVTSDWAPAVDIKEEDDRFILVADIPGVAPKDIDVHMENGILTIKGERESETKTEREGYKRIEREHGIFLSPLHYARRRGRGSHRRKKRQWRVNGDHP